MGDKTTFQTIDSVSVQHAKFTRDKFPCLNKERERKIKKKTLEFKSTLKDDINIFTRGNDQALTIVFFSVVQLLTWRYSDQTNFSLLFPKQQLNPKAENKEMLSVECLVNGKTSCTEFLNETKKSILNAYKESSLTYCSKNTSIVFSIGGKKVKREVAADTEQIAFDFFAKEKQMGVQITYSDYFYSDQLIAALLSRLEIILDTFVTNKNSQIADLPIGHSYPDEISAQELQLKSLEEMLKYQFQKNKQSMGLKDSKKMLIYEEIDCLSNNLAQTLLDNGINSESKVALYASRSVDAVIMILAIYRAGAVYVPLDTSAPDERNKLILEDCQPEILLLDEQNANFSKEISVKTLVYKQELFEGKRTEIETGNQNEHLYIIYTSGTTGKPKGIQFRAKAMENLIAYEQKNCTFSLSKAVSQFASLAFDVASQEIWSTLCSGGCLNIIDEKCKKDLIYFLSYFEKNKIDTVFLPTSFFKMLKADAANLDRFLKTVDDVIVAGEALTIDRTALKQLAKNNVRLHNHYGPSETHVISMEEVMSEHVTIGQPIQNTEFYILDEKENSVPFGAPGMLYVAGECLASGYLNNQEKTDEVFKEIHVNGKTRKTYKTGDVARQLGNQKYEYIGRKDNQLKIRGYRVELQEIEKNILSIEAVDLIKVLPIKKQKDTKLIAFYSGNISKEDLKTALLEILPDYMVPYTFEKYEKLPLNQNGKINSHKLLKDYQTTVQNITKKETVDEVESKIRRLWETALGEEDPEGITSFFELGGNSIDAMLLCTKLSREFSITLQVHELFANDSIEKLYAYIIAKMTETDEVLTAIPQIVKEHYCLSSAQNRIHFMQQMDPDSTLYNIPFTFSLEGKLDVQQLSASLKKLVENHAIFRTSFLILEDEVVQKINPSEKYSIMVKDLSNCANLLEAESKFVQPFDLSEDLLIRMGIFNTADEQEFLLIDMHHIASDGISMTLILKELNKYYQVQSEGTKGLSYKDYAEYTKTEAYEKLLNKQGRFWKEEFADYQQLSVNSMKLDDQYKGEIKEIVIHGDKLAFVDTFVREKRLTKYTFLFALFSKVLRDQRIQADVIGTPASGRDKPELQEIIGLFVNTLPIRIPTDKNFMLFLDNFSKKVLDALENQNYPFERIIEWLRSGGKIKTNQLFDVMFAYQTYKEPLKIGKTVLCEEPQTNSVEKVGLTANVVDYGSSVKIQMSYNQAIYSDEQIDSILKNLEDYLQDIERTSQTPLENKVKKFEYSKYRTVIEEFELQVEKNPDNIAVVQNELSYSYRDVNNLAAKVKQKLYEIGIKKGDAVCINFEKGINWITSMLGVLKCGAVYVPLDNEFPLERKRYMLTNSGCKVVIGMKEEPSFNIETVTWGDILKTEEQSNLSDTKYSFSLEDPIYIMYTSGTTGFPKGVIVSNKGIIRLVKEDAVFSISSKESVMHGASLAFDASTFELFGPLLNGGTIVVTTKDQLIDVVSLEKMILTHQIQTAFFTTPLFNSLCEQNPAVFNHLKKVIIGGDRASVPYVKKAMESNQQTNFYNAYGPTENTAITSIHHIRNRDLEREIPIGRVVNDTTVLVLDEQLQEVPEGEVGELYITGGGLATAYVDNKVATKEAFISLPDYDCERAYKTGDLVQIKDGVLEFIGRKDNQVKYRGFRIELSEIEKTTENFPGVFEAVCLITNKNVQPKLILFIVSSNVVQEKLELHLKKNLPNYMIPQEIITLQEFPLKPNGKINIEGLMKLKDIDLLDEADSLNLSDDEQLFLATLEDALTQKELSLKMNFFDIGGHSLNATIVAAKLTKAFKEKITVRDVFLNPNLTDMLSAIREKMNAQIENVSLEKILPVSEQESYPSSPTQSRIFLLNVSQKDTSYNVPYFIKLKRSIDKDKLLSALLNEIKENEILRTVYQMDQNKVMQKILPFKEDLLNISYLYSEGNEWSTFKEQLVTYFDLTKDIPIRAAIIKSAEEEILFLDIHHIAIDGFSMNQLLKNLEAVYLDHFIERPAISYKDYAVWMNQKILSEEYAVKKRYWLDAFETAIPDIQLGIEKSSTIDLKKTAYLSDEIDPIFYAGLKKYAAEKNVSLNMIFMTALYILIYKYSCVKDIVIGSPASGRINADLEKIIGSFINTLPVRYQVQPEETIYESLTKVSTKIMDSLEYQEYPVDLISAELSKISKKHKNALFNFMFVMQNNYEDQNKSELFEDYAEVPIDSKMNMIFEAIDLGETVQIQATYPIHLYDEKDVSKMMKALLKIVKAVIIDDTQKIYSLEVISEYEKGFLNKGYNYTEYKFKNSDFPMKELIEQSAEVNGTEIAVQCDDEILDFTTLNMRANFLAKKLKEKGIKKGTVVGVKKSRDISAIIDILALIKLGAVYVPLDADTPDERVRKISVKSAMSYLLCEQPLVISDLPIINTGAQEYIGLEKNNEKTAIQPTDELYIIFTSGSTGEPKGVVISNEQCVNTILDVNDRFSVTPDDKLGLISSFAFDLSVYDLFGALVSGARVVLASKAKDSNYLKQLLKNNQITVWNTVPAYMELMCDSLEEDAQILSMRNIILSGDWIPLELPGKIRKKFPRANLYSAGGATEGSIWSIIYPIHETKENWKTIPYGMPLTNQKMYILNESGNELPIGVLGEICIGGKGVAVGYINDIEKTTASFVDHEKFGKIYKTGDLGRMSEEGYIEFCGRKDYQVKINGYRIELEEIQTVLQSHKEIEKSLVIVNEDNDQLLAYYVSEQPLLEDEIREYAKNELPKYMIPQRFIHIRSFPVTNNGKIDRKALPLPAEKIANEWQSSDVQPRNRIEKLVWNIWQTISDIQPESIFDSFFSIGGNSLSATLVLGEIQSKCTIEITMDEFYENDTIEKLANLIIDKMLIINEEEDSLNEIKSSNQENLVSPQQSRMVLNQVFDSDSTTLNIPLVFILNDSYKKDVFENSVKKLMQRHQILTTAFEIGEEGISQRIGKNELVINHQNADTFDLNQLIRPFDLMNQSLVRLTYLSTLEENYLMLEFHHSIIDGYSLSLLQKELYLLLKGESLQGNMAQYSEYCTWMNEFVQSEKYKQQELFWKETFKEYSGIQRTEIQLKEIRTKRKNMSGKSIEFELPRALFKKINAISKEKKMSNYVLMLSVYSYMLHEMNGLTDFVVGTPVSGRTNQRFINTIGVFINTLPIRICMENGENYWKLVHQVNQRVRQALNNQDYQFDHLVNLLGIAETNGKNPLFDTMFNYHNYTYERQGLEAYGLKQFTVPQISEKFDFSLTFEESGEKLFGCFSYDDYLLEEKVANEYVECFLDLCAKIFGENKEPKNDSKLKKTQITQKEVEIEDIEINIFHDIEAQFSVTKNKVALASSSETVNYTEMERKIDKYTKELSEQGAGKFDRIAIKMERSIQNVLAILAVLKIGGCYIPIDLEFPKERQDFILKDSNCKFILTDSGIDRNPYYTEEICDKENLAYIIYTSGSTGNPKGVRITQENLKSFLISIDERLEFHNYSSVLCVTSISFDIFVLETLLPLFKGKTCVVADKKEVMNTSLLSRLIVENQIDVIQSTPSRWSIFLEDTQFTSVLKEQVKLLLTGGEKLTSQVAEKLLETKGNVINLYGPTEATVWAFTSEITDSDAIYLGEPLNNTKAVILDSSNNQVVKGELCLSGSGISPGYHNLQQMTEKRFRKASDGKTILYYTGDIVERTTEGQLLFIGREDDQVKINGYRVELGEIDTAISKIDGIARVKTIYFANENSLIAYCEGKKGIDELLLRTELGRQLPGYMLPNHFVFLESIPLMVNGKIDTTSLKKLAVKQELPIADLTRGFNKTETDLFEAFRSIAKIELRRNENFFEVGLSSLNILRVTQRLKKNYEIDYSDLMDFPTIKGLADKIEDQVKSFGEENQKGESEKMSLDFKKVFKEGIVHKKGQKDILLTGSTGFLGCHIFSELLKGDHFIRLIIRGRNQVEAYERLKATFKHYLSQDLKKYKDKFAVYCGDLTKVEFGLTTEDYADLVNNTDRVINTAANVKHFGKYKEFYTANVCSVENIIDFCKKSDAILFHLSTISLSSIFKLKDMQIFSETSIPAECQSSNVYLRSKYEAEKIILNEIGNNLKASIIRVGNLVFNSKTGTFQKNIEENAFYQIIRAYIKLGVLPDDQSPSLEFTYVDQCAVAINQLISNDHTSGIYHYYNQNKISFSDLYDYLKERYTSMKKVPYERILEISEEYDKEKREYIDILKIHLADEENGTMNQVSNDITNEILLKMGFQWSKVNKESIDLMLNYCADVNFI
ncbi:non-ribosomal peptide synthetase [Carnobacterium divergens]|uniref:non-ribosomal peptide synthetase n=1 Tax=Carnobacterium divergens TaxID=2748 RepID=UPI0007F3CC60|nr:non-ribosomal peptide synthetase [Carnobacterium divergens]SBO17135.1 NRPS-PKS protein involved in antibiotic synthesis, similar to Surfactin/Gramicidin/Mycosubtilin/Bacitracin synthase [Carnobacterium divergens]